MLCCVVTCCFCAPSSELSDGGQIGKRIAAQFLALGSHPLISSDVAVQVVVDILLPFVFKLLQITHYAHCDGGSEVHLHSHESALQLCPGADDVWKCLKFSHFTKELASTGPPRKMPWFHQAKESQSNVYTKCIQYLYTNLRENH